MKGIADLGQLGKDVLEHEEQLAKQVYVTNGHVVINAGYEYNIELDRCDTLEKILAWTSHLCEKTWMTTELLERFIQLAASHHKLDLPNP